MPRVVSLVCWGVFLMGLGLLGGGGTWASRTSAFQKKATSVVGTVVELAPHTGSEGDLLYAPVVRYREASGAEQTYRSSTASAPAAYRMGEQVEVLYDPGRPGSATLGAFMDLWFGPMILFALGTFFTVGGGVALLVFRLHRRPAEQRPTAGHGW